MSSVRRTLATLVCVAFATGCDAPPDGAGVASSPECVVVRRDVALDGAIRESSGVVIDPRDPDVFWTHNDSGHEAELFSVGRDGRTLSRMTVTGAENQDWEELAHGPCPEAGSCLFIFDAGDSGRRRRDPVVLYRVPLPEPGAARTAAATRIEARYPDGHLDTEAAFVLPDGSVHLINKGQRHPIDLWRWPGPSADGVAVLERVRTLAPQPDQPGDRVTGAAASPDGRWVVIRTYGRLAFYRTDELLDAGEAAFTMDLTPLGEPQGEAVALANDGTVLLTSEAGTRALPPRANWLRCRLP
jgi:hypothetical protein